ncbi:MAG: hypothetical protein ACKV22_04085 [Bryobacteraceae bacterium]
MESSQPHSGGPAGDRVAGLVTDDGDQNGQLQEDHLRDETRSVRTVEHTPAAPRNVGQPQAGEADHLGQDIGEFAGTVALKPDRLGLWRIRNRGRGLRAGKSDQSQDAHQKVDFAECERTEAKEWRAKQWEREAGDAGRNGPCPAGGPSFLQSPPGDGRKEVDR